MLAPCRLFCVFPGVVSLRSSYVQIKEELFALGVPAACAAQHSAQFHPKSHSCNIALVASAGDAALQNPKLWGSDQGVFCMLG